MSAKLTVRDWQESDMPTLAAMHEKMDVGYTLPETSSPLFCIKKTVVDEDGKVLGMATVKLVSEAFLWIDNGDEISALTKAKSVKLLNEACAKDAEKLGLDSVSAWIPEKIANCFGSIIKKLGWQRSRWASWSTQL